ncbi:MAG: hypothetical protein PF517_10960 [Salinivirgaceae bacterium]|jgi:hypothetical protein|nr:hypothetical protein [Salinivirgaceae bacterium]
MRVFSPLFILTYFLATSCTKSSDKPIVFNTDNKFVNITPQFLTSEATSCWFFNENSGMVSTNDGLLVKSDDAGATWQSIDIEGASHLSDLFFYNSAFGFCIDNKNTTYLYDTAKWSTYNFPVKNTTPSSFQMLDSEIIYASTLMGENDLGYLVKSNNSGITWDTVFSTTSDIEQILMLNEQNGFFISNSDNEIGLFKTTDAWHGWFSRIPSFYGTYFSGTVRLVKLLALDNDHLVAIGRGDRKSEGIILVSIDGGESWNLEIINHALNDIYATDSTLYFVGDELFVASWLINVSRIETAYSIIDTWKEFNPATDFVLSEEGVAVEYYHDIIQIQFVDEQHGFIITNNLSLVFKITLNSEIYDKS